MIEFKVKYTGPDAAEIRTGEVYLAHELADNKRMLGVKDRSGEWYAYPADLFTKVEE